VAFLRNALVLYEKYTMRWCYTLCLIVKGSYGCVQYVGVNCNFSGLMNGNGRLFDIDSKLFACNKSESRCLQLHHAVCLMVP